MRNASSLKTEKILILALAALIAIIISSNTAFAAITYYNTSSGNNISIGNPLFIDNTNLRIGVNTHSPITDLHVHAPLASSNYSRIKLTNTLTGTGTTDGLDIIATGNEAYIIQRENANMTFRTNNADVMTLLSTGGVGIGTTNPGKKLEIYEDNSATTTTTGILVTNPSTTVNSRAGILFKNYDNNGAAIWSPRTGSASGYLIFGTNSGAGIAETNIAEGMRLDNNGRLGIGSTSPSSKLHVSGNISVYNSQSGSESVAIDFYPSYSGGLPAYGIGMGPTASEGYLTYRGGSGSTSVYGHKFYVNNAEMMRIRGDGTVGIGTSSPLGDAADLTLGSAAGTQGRLYLYGSTAGAYSLIQTTNGNLHIDAHTGAYATYLNYYTGTGGVYFGSGTTGYNAYVTAAGAMTVTTLNTGLGAYELYAMNQNLQTSDRPTFAGLTSTGNITISGSTILYLSASGISKMTEGWGMELRGDATHPVQVLDSPLLINYDAAGGNYGTTGLLVNGNVGIGTDTPDAKLDVAGDIFLTNNGYLYANSVGNLIAKAANFQNDPGTTISSLTGWSITGGTSKNQITAIAGINGGYIKAYNIMNAGAADVWGGTTDTVNVDARATYRVSAWIRQDSTDPTVYFGLITDGSMLNMNGGASDGNPYVWFGDLPQVNTWYRVVAYVYAYGTTGTSTLQGGIYDIKGYKVASINTEYKFSSATGRTLQLRFWNAYGDGTNNVYIYDPRIEIASDFENPMVNTDLGIPGILSIGTATPPTNYPLTIYKGSQSDKAQILLNKSGIAWDIGMASNEGNFWIGDAVTAVRLAINRSTGHVGVGDTTPDYRLDVWGTICQDTDSNEVCDGTVTSDERLKTNITIIRDSIQKIQALNGVYFYWNDTINATEFLGRGHRQIGMIAQEVEQTFPELIYQDMEGYKMIDYQKLTGITINAIKEQQTQIEELRKQNIKIQSENEKLRKYNTELERRLSQIEAKLSD